MGCKNAHMSQLERQFALGALAGRIRETNFCCDVLQITMGRKGWGPKRLKELAAEFSAVYEELDSLCRQDGKDDKDNWYFKDTVDAELRKYVAPEDFVPFKERHGW